MTLAWGANWPVIKIAVNEIPVFTLRFCALLIGAVGLFAIARLKGASMRISLRELPPLFFVSLGNVTFWHVFSAIGVAQMAAGHASILGFTMPLWVAFIASLWGGDKLSLTHIIGLLMGMLGLGFLLYPDRAFLWINPWGPIAMLGGAVSWAVGTVGMQRFKFNVPLISLVAWQLLIGALPLLLGVFTWENNFSFQAVSGKAILALLYMGFVATIYGNWAWFKVVSIYPAFVASISSLAIPVVGVLTSTALLGEPLGLVEILALFLISAALFIVLIFPKLYFFRKK